MLNTQIYIFIIGLWLLFARFDAQSQNIEKQDSIWQIPEITVSDKRLPSFGFFHAKETIDSTFLQLKKLHNVANISTWQSGIFVKNYGPGRLATTSLRGMSSAHTAVIWQGFNLQSPMFGLIDLALLPAFLIDDIQIQYGGNSALWGSGAVGGAIHLEQNITFNKGWETTWQTQVGSFKAFNNGLKIHYSNPQFFSNTKIFHEKAKNNFPYTTDDASTQKLAHATLTQYALLQENGFQIDDQQQIRWNIWYQKADRDIPPTIGQARSVAAQTDRIFRSNLSWQKSKDRNSFQARTAFFREQLNYQDSIAQIDTDSRAFSWISEAEAKIKIGQQQLWNIAWNNTYAWAKSTSYNGRPHRNESALFMAYHWHNQKNTVRLVGSFRQALVNGKLVPTAPAIGGEWRLFPALKINAHISRNYRLPAFDDLYWATGGNPDLLAEKGWSESIRFSFKQEKKAWQWQINSSLFNHQVRQWIIWLPNGNWWTPRNLLKVWSRGIENEIVIYTQAQAWKIQANIRHSFTKSSNQKARSPSDNSVGKQLIYVPLHQASAQLQLFYHNFGLLFNHRYYGNVYILADHSAKLPAYQLEQLVVHWNFSFKQIKGQLSASVNNLWNTSYQVVVNRPMPGRHYELGMILKR